jgi:phage-related protein
MNTKKIVFEKLFQKKTELASHKIDLSLMEDVERQLDKANSKRRNLVKMAKKISDDLNNLQSDYAQAIQIAAKGEQAAKEIGSEEARKFFGNRGDEAKDFSKAVGSAANKIFSSVANI